MSLTTSLSSDSSSESRKGDTSGVLTDSAFKTMSFISRNLGGAYGPNGFTFSIVKFKRSSNERKKRFTSPIIYLKEKIDVGCAIDEDRMLRINRLQDLDDVEKLEAMDLVQKARVKWEVEGDENLKFFHGVINSKRNS
ncbi:hypothetical protein Tco_1067812 [Tanacetum coccineum]|uniref:RNA-directed DNA polymerase, eukaryota n=1 Tax=Tanacetum coccineum TaxID=301880 RepID=A0ABQ5HEH6_9ASTR